MASPSVPGATALIGREAELAELAASLDATLAGAGRMVFVGGEPGIGKTRLAEALAVLAQDRGARVLWGRCSDDAGAPAYWPWIQLIRGCLRDQDAEALVALMGPGAADIAQAVAEVRERLPHLPPPLPLAPEQARFRFFDSVTTFLVQAARARPLLLILDDLHWADTPSLLLLEFLGRELRAGHLLVVGTYRDGGLEHDHALARMLAALVRARVSEQVVLGGLSEQAVARCIAAIIGVEPPPEQVATVHRETGGNPFYVTEIARLVAMERQCGGAVAETLAGRAGPHGLRQVLDSRLGDLAPESLRVLTLAAVIGHEFGVAELRRALEPDGAPLLDALEQAERARVITPVPGTIGRYRFAHALIREALYEDLPASRRIRLHRRVAEALEGLYATATPAPPALGQLAHHFVQAAPGGDVDKAIAYARRAGDAAIALMAYEEAARYYRLALQALELRPEMDEAQHCALLLALGEAQNWSGETVTARQTLQQAAAMAARLGDAEAQARAALGYGAVSPAVSVDGVRITLLRQALAALGERDSLTRVMLLASLPGALYWSEQPEHCIELSEQALAVATRLGDPMALAHALNAKREALWRPEHLHDRVPVVAAMRDAAVAAGSQELALQASRWMIVDSLELGDRATMDREIAAHARLADAVRQPLPLWRVARWQALHAVLDGRLVEAEELIQQALVLGRRTQRRDATALYLVQWGALRRLQGRAAELEPALREVADGYPDTPAWRAGLAAVEAELGRADEARRDLERVAGDGFAGIPRDANWLVALTSLAQACALLADRERAAALYDVLLPYHEQIVVVGGAVACYGAVAHYLGLLAAALGRWDEAQAHYDEAAALHERLGARPWLAITHYHSAALLLARDGPGDREQARALATGARESASELGMAALAEQARALCDQIEHGAGPGCTSEPDEGRLPGGRASSAPSAGAWPGSRQADGLTAREREVVRLLARGLTNREIAAALVIADRTADAHVGNILGKLGFRSRAQVAAWAVERGLLTTDDD